MRTRYRLTEHSRLGLTEHHRQGLSEHHRLGLVEYRRLGLTEHRRLGLTEHHHLGLPERHHRRSTHRYRRLHLGSHWFLVSCASLAPPHERTPTTRTSAAVPSPTANQLWESRTVMLAKRPPRVILTVGSLDFAYDDGEQPTSDSDSTGVFSDKRFSKEEKHEPVINPNKYEHAMTSW